VVNLGIGMPGVDLERDILAQTGFRPAIRRTPRVMDADFLSRRLG
jgi:acyl CoA:acetate/3-ketoacid CoA transferase